MNMVAKIIKLKNLSFFHSKFKNANNLSNFIISQFPVKFDLQQNIIPLLSSDLNKKIIVIA